MSWTFVACVGISFAWMGLFYVWGRGFLTSIKAKRDASSCVSFGYLVLQVIYQIIYLPFYFTRGSYRATAYIWLVIVVITSIVLVLHMWRNSLARTKKRTRAERLGIIVASLLVLGLSVYIALHVPFYGQDTMTYISAMNESFYRDTMWLSTRSSFHYGMSSMYQFFTISSLLTGIKPYYISLFTVRIVGVCLFSLIVYRTGCVLYKKGAAFCWSAIIIAVLVPFLLLFWGSNYTAEFFYWRINEAKGFGQFVLLPLGFSIFLEMLRKGADRKPLWRGLFLTGLAAIPVSASSLTPFLFLLLMGLFALLAYDKFKRGLQSIIGTVLCALPNLLYLTLYVLESKGYVIL